MRCSTMGTDEKIRIASALKLIRDYGGFDGAHHKQWVLDQVVRNLTKGGYMEWVRGYETEDDDPRAYVWDEGIPP